MEQEQRTPVPYLFVMHSEVTYSALHAGLLSFPSPDDSVSIDDSNIRIRAQTRERARANR
ncbi:MAG: hypothetical protein RLZZ387_382 [Chloroflexota bacterium]|jgi:hypothetical protein